MIQLIGNVTRDANAKTVSGKQVINFTIALNYTYKKANGELLERVTYIDCNYWATTEVYKHLNKGRLVAVFGDIYLHTYQNAGGNFKAIIRCNVNALQLFTSKNIEQPSPHSTKDPATPDDQPKRDPIQGKDDLPF